jgi:hypothetical protein
MIDTESSIVYALPQNITMFIVSEQILNLTLLVAIKTPAHAEEPISHLRFLMYTDSEAQSGFTSYIVIPCCLSFLFHILIAKHINQFLKGPLKRKFLR